MSVRLKDDLLAVYADAFERDADPDDFSLESIVAHERGHQLLARHPRLVRSLPGPWSSTSEEIVASLLGSLVADREQDQQDLLAKALFDADQEGRDPAQTALFIVELRALLRKIL